MSTRERWTIYPLLFLALGAALRSKVTSSIEVGSLTSRKMEATQVKANQILCEDLVIAGGEGKPRVRLGSTRAETGAIELYGRDGRVLATLSVDPATNRAAFQLQAPDGTPQVVLYCEDSGGMLNVHGKSGQLQATMRSTTGGGLVTAVDPAGKILIEPGHRTGEPGEFVSEPPGTAPPLVPPSAPAKVDEPR